ncbi:MAG: cytochrome P450, partial [Sphingobium yanoikuyae]|nr:cytochrome P450 [Sphingobium yanoikuyae]
HVRQRGLSELHVKLTPAAGVDLTTASAEPAVKPQEKTAGDYSTAKTKIGELLANPVTLAVLDHHFPGMSQDKRLAMAKGMTLRSVQKFAPGQFSDAALDAVDADLAAI